MLGVEPEGGHDAHDAAGLSAIATPGHAADHVCFILERELPASGGITTCFTGDLILGEGSTIVPPREHGGSLADYMASLHRLNGMTLDLAAPRPRSRDHRSAREDQRVPQASRGARVAAWRRPSTGASARGRPCWPRSGTTCRSSCAGPRPWRCRRTWRSSRTREGSLPTSGCDSAQRGRAIKHRWRLTSAPSCAGAPPERASAAPSSAPPPPGCGGSSSAARCPERRASCGSRVSREPSRSPATAGGCRASGPPPRTTSGSARASSTARTASGSATCSAGSHRGASPRSPAREGLPVDQLMRTLGLRRIALREEAELARRPALPARRLLRRHQRAPPRPPPRSPPSSRSSGSTSSPAARPTCSPAPSCSRFGLSTNWERELLRADLVRELGDGARGEDRPHLPEGKPGRPAARARAANGDGLDLAEQIGKVREQIGLAGAASAAPTTGR